MSLSLRQWDVVKVRINPEDRDEHPAVIVSPDEICSDSRRTKLNLLYGSSRRPAQAAQPHEVVLDEAEGLDRPTIFDCVYFYGVDRRKIQTRLGGVGAERRRRIGRTIVASYRFPL